MALNYALYLAAYLVLDLIPIIWRTLTSPRIDD
jgi:hypothetical protein